MTSQHILNNTPKDNKGLEMPEYIILEDGKIMKLRNFAAVLRRHKFSQERDPHEYFYSENMLFHPWYSESEIFPNDATKCQSLFEEVDDPVDGKCFTKIDNVKKALFPHLDDVVEGREMVEKFDYDQHLEIGTEIDPTNTQQVEDDTELGAKDAEEYIGLHPDDFSTMNDDDETDTIVAEKMYRAPEVIDMDQLLADTRQLVAEQQIALNRIIEYCKHLVKCQNSKQSTKLRITYLVIHVGAGTGKSTIIKIMSRWITKILQTPGDDTDYSYFIKAAPTGKAAANIGGATLHSVFKLNFGHNYKYLSDKNREYLRDMFKNVQVIIIDEFSMIQSDQLYQLHQRLCEIKQSDQPFANTSVVLLGDMMQLKPIRGGYIFQRPKSEKYKQVYDTLNLWELFECIDLEMNHRQGEDKVYAGLLNRIRFKSKDENLNSEDLKLLQSRVVSENNEEVTKIFGKHVSVNAENTSRLETLPGKMFTITAQHNPSTRNVKVNADGTIESSAFLQNLQVKVDAKVMLIFNVNTPDGLTNGAQGTIKQILTSGENVRYILIKFEDITIGREHRLKFKFLKSICNLDEVTPIERHTFSYTLGDICKNHAARATLLQFPVRLSWALTAHKVSFIWGYSEITLVPFLVN